MTLSTPRRFWWLPSLLGYPWHKSSTAGSEPERRGLANITQARSQTKRTAYAISREVITRGDDGGSHFNTSELAGNAVAAGISNFYYPAADRSFGNTTYKWGQQIALDAFFNVAKEFWPDVRNKLFGH
jgi:hypothetical protein